MWDSNCHRYKHINKLKARIHYRHVENICPTNGMCNSRRVYPQCRSGRPTWTVTVENAALLKDLLNNDRRFTVRGNADELSLSYYTVQRILTGELNMAKVAARWIPLSKFRCSDRIWYKPCDGNDHRLIKMMLYSIMIMPFSIVLVIHMDIEHPTV